MTHPPPDPEGRQKHMHMNTDPEWLRQMAEKEDGCIVSVGGLVHDLEAAEAEIQAQRVAGATCPYCAACFERRRQFREGLAARLDAALATKDEREAVERCWALVRELRGEKGHGT